MQNEYEVPFELTFNAEAEVMNNLFVHDLILQDEIVISDSKVKYLFENDVFIELTFNKDVESVSDEYKNEILLENPDAIFEDEEYISTTISANKPFKAVEKIDQKINEKSIVETSMVYLTFEQ